MNECGVVRKGDKLMACCLLCIANTLPRRVPNEPEIVPRPSSEGSSSTSSRQKNAAAASLEGGGSSNKVNPMAATTGATTACHNRNNPSSRKSGGVGARNGKSPLPPLFSPGGDLSPPGKSKSRYVYI